MGKFEKKMKSQIQAWRGCWKISIISFAEHAEPIENSIFAKCDFQMSSVLTCKIQIFTQIFLQWMFIGTWKKKEGFKKSIKLKLDVVYCSGKF